MPPLRHNHETMSCVILLTQTPTLITQGSSPLTNLDSSHVVAFFTGAVLAVCGFGLHRAFKRAAHSDSSSPITATHVLSHEIRTPLSLIKGAAELLADESAGTLNADQRHFVETITDNSERVIAMAEDFLTDAKLDSPNFTLTYCQFDLRELLRDTARELREVNDVQIFLRDTGEPLILSADRVLMRHVAWNLINNAVRHAGTESCVEIRTYPTVEGAVVEIRDDGRGMTPTERSDLFTPFAHAGNPTTAAGSGTGIGLGIVERIVRLHHGRIIVDTLTGKGTSIHVVTPWEPPPSSSGYVKRIRHLLARLER